MATVSTRIDTKSKEEAQKIASEIGIPLGTAINVFLKRFVFERGFPFQVVAASQRKATFEDGALDAAVKKAIYNSTDSTTPHQFTYLAPEGTEYITAQRKA